MQRLLAVDPGKHASGWALFEGPELILCGLDEAVSCPAWGQGADVEELAIELPQAYDRRISKVRNADLIDLARVVGGWELLTRLRRPKGRPPAQIRTWTPAQWKGQLNKSIVHARAEAVLGTIEKIQLTAGIAGLRKKQVLDVKDAVALGLVHLGRLRLRW